MYADHYVGLYGNVENLGYRPEGDKSDVIEIFRKQLKKIET
jgi:hypothetical protein